MRTRVTVSVAEELVAWIDDKTREGTFRNRSHAVEWSLETMKKALEEWEKTRAPITITLRKVP